MAKAKIKTFNYFRTFTAAMVEAGAYMGTAEVLGLKFEAGCMITNTDARRFLKAVRVSYSNDVNVPKDLIRDLMNYDRANFPAPAAKAKRLFRQWAEGGACPYGGDVLERRGRAAWFTQERSHYNADWPVVSAPVLVLRALLAWNALA